MIDIVRKEDCVGCNACVQRCPKTCISMEADEQGFLYPKVDLDRCIDCHLCEKVCPVINQSEPRKPLGTYAAKNKDAEIQRQSSSGGVFFALAEKIIEDGGVVFGARFDENWEVIHDFAESHEQVKAFLGSKYVQSKIGNTYSQAEAFLKEERKVLFSGTPCQIAGLRLFLKKDYGDILILVDTACHGVPSPMIWKEFLIENSKNNGYSINSIYDISFRDKRNGWDKYGMRIVYKKNGRQNEWFCPLTENVFMNGFLNDLYLRPSCYACPAKCGKSHSDMMLADFWGLRNAYPSYYKEGYYSLILVKSLKGKRVLQCTRHISFCEANYKHALAGNPSIERSINKPKSYDKFWFYFHNEGIIAITKILAKIKPSLFKKVYSTILHHFSIILRNIGLRK